MVASLLLVACDDPVDPLVEAQYAWLERAARPLAGSHHALPKDDLHFLREFVGDARIVALGEDTHGTEEFFEMKARILRYLVEELEFDALIMEANLPEAARLDRYVRSGVGDPAVALSGLYFWTWRTTSVLEMIRWMRSANAAGRAVGFYGNDMQYAGMALHNVIKYVENVDPASSAETWATLGCMNRFANDAQGRTRQRYAEADPSTRAECGDSLQAMSRRLADRRQAYVAASSEPEFTLAARNLRVAEQLHLHVQRVQSRDESMAENTAWWLDRLGDDSRVVVWAHNFHLATRPNAQGSWLRERYGDDLVVIGFSHERGRFTGLRLPMSTNQGIRPLDLDPVKQGSYEAIFAGVVAPRFFLDLRPARTDPDASWLATPRPFRAIGCCFDPAEPDAFWIDVALPHIFDAVIHFRETNPTILLPASMPSSFDD